MRAGDTLDLRFYGELPEALPEGTEVLAQEWIEDDAGPNGEVRYTVELAFRAWGEDVGPTAHAAEDEMRTEEDT